MPIHVRFQYAVGSSLSYSLERNSNGWIYDTSTSLFSAAPAATLAALAEGAGNYAGRYLADLVSTPVGTFPDGWYTCYVHDAGSSNRTVGALVFWMSGGDEVLPAGSAGPTAAAIRVEMDTNSTKLANLTGPTALASQIPANFATLSITTGQFSATALALAPAAPTVAAIRTEMDANSTKLARITANVATAAQIPANFASLVITSGAYSAAALANAPGGTAPTVVQIRTELDNNSAKLANLTGPVATAAPIPANLNTLGISAGSYDATALVNAPAGGGGTGGGPTAAQIRVEMDTNSAKLAYLTAPTATAAMIPANFAAVGINASGVFSAAALANAPGGTFPTVAQIRVEMDTNSTKLANLTGPAALASTIPAGFGSVSITGGAFDASALVNAPAAPTVAAIRTDLDTNSVRLANLTGPVATASQIPPSFWTLGIVDGSYDARALQNAPSAGSVVAVDGSGRVLLQPAGLDAVSIESGLNARQALSVAVASAAGTLTGTENGHPMIAGAGVSVIRIEAATDGQGNRASTIHPPA